MSERLRILTSAALTLEGEPAGRAVVSGDGAYRYSLTRVWGARGPLAVWLLLNPSTATHDTDDPTLIRCVRYSRAWGFRGLTIVNLFAFRATDPRKLQGHPDPVGPANDRFITRLCERGALIIAGWGAAGGDLARFRAAHVMTLLDVPGVEVSCLGLTTRGDPRHPLFMRAADEPRPYQPRKAATR